LALVAATVDQPSSSRRKLCPSCAAEFGCADGAPGCWCEAVALARETLAELRVLADDCLCPACLAGFAARDASRASANGTARAGSGHWAKAIPHDAIRARGVPPLWGLGALLILVVALLFALTVGAVPIGTGAIAQSALAKLPLLHIRSPLSATNEAIVWQLRAPRVVLAALVGGMLAIAGCAYQGVFRNPLADPYFLGVAAGAGLGATFVIVYAASRRAAASCCRSPRSPAQSSASRRLRARQLGRRQRQHRGADPRRRQRRRVHDRDADVPPATAHADADRRLLVAPRRLRAPTGSRCCWSRPTSRSARPC
jgi:hypothetical protein